MAVRLESHVKRFIGLSTDDKPLETDMPAGSSFLESDTGHIFRWDGEMWRCPIVEQTQADDPTVDTLNWILVEIVKLRELVEIATS